MNEIKWTLGDKIDQISPPTPPPFVKHCIAHICIWAAFCTVTMTTRLVQVLMRRILVERSFAKQGSLCYRFSTRHLLPRSDTQWHGGQKIGQGAISRFEQKSCSTQMWRKETRRNRTCWVAANFWHESGFWETEDVDSSAADIRGDHPDHKVRFVKVLSFLLGKVLTHFYPI